MVETHSLADEIRREHAVLRLALDEIAGELERLEAESGPAPRGGRLLGMLTMFRLHLVRHFELEEQGGLLVDRAEWNPGVRRTIKGLVEEHGTLGAQLDSLIESLQLADTGNAPLPDMFAPELKDFLALLRTHEHSENQLAQEIVQRDIGAGD